MNFNLNNLGRVEDDRFPLTFKLKVIMVSGDEPSANRPVLEHIFERLGIKASDWDEKPSSGSRYIRYSVAVTISSRALMDSLYRELGRESLVKAAI